MAYFNSHTREGVTTAHDLQEIWRRFQLTHPWGCDALVRYECSPKPAISTHTPVRVWRWNFVVLWMSLHFNSHTREGVTPLKWSTAVPWSFQLTHPWGCDNIGTRDNTPHSISTHTPVRVWPSNPCFFNPCFNFNSHTREGVTIIIVPSEMIFLIFQLTHPWGCDLLLNSPFIIWLAFQLTHPWGCDTLMHWDFKI